VHVAYGCDSVLLWHGDEIPSRWGNLGVFSTLTMNYNVFAAKRDNSCSRRDHSLCQAIANRIWKILMQPISQERKGKGKEEYLYSAFLHQGTHKVLRKGVMGVHCAGEV